jgi:hypothetical protein
MHDLHLIRDATRRRESSWDTTGGNADAWLIGPGETRTMADMTGPGCVRHIWITTMSREDAYLRKSVLRMYWDGADSPCVEAPLGDFFGVGHGMMVDFWSQPLTMSPRDGRGFNCYFPMPFREGGRITITNEGERRLILYFYVDYETYQDDRPTAWEASHAPSSNVRPSAVNNRTGLFHAQWRRQDPTDGWGRTGSAHTDEERAGFWRRPNLDGEGNYVILEAEGRGHYVGCNLNIDVFEKQQNDWYGEGDDMIWIDGELAIRGTGTEDYFNTAFSPETVFCTPYHGITVYQGTKEWPWSGKNSMYRYHIEDPIHFRESIKVTIEHGHANDLSNDYSSTAYWYQTHPHAHPHPLLPVADRLPR